MLRRMALLHHPPVFILAIESKTSPHAPLGIALGNSEAVMGPRVCRLQYAEKDIVNAFHQHQFRA